MAEIEITREDSGSKVRYVARIAGLDAKGELTLSKLSDDLVIADHTAVPEAMRGSGAARALLERLVADARAAGQRIVPLCPYVRVQAVRRKDDWADVIQW